MRSSELSTRNPRVLLIALLVAFLFAVVQFQVCHYIAQHLQHSRITDGVVYLNEGNSINAKPSFIQKLDDVAAHGFYPLFLSRLPLDYAKPWDGDAADPRLIHVLTWQARLLGCSTALLLFFTFMLTRASLPVRIIVTILLGCLMLSPVIVTWPSQLWSESITIPLMLLLMAACLLYDAWQNTIVILMLCCLAVFMSRAPAIYFVGPFFGLLLVSIWSSARKSFHCWLGTLAIISTIALAGVRADFVPVNDRYVFLVLANIIQVRILPDPDRKEYFVQHGLPASDLLNARAGKPYWVDDKYMKSDNELAAYPDYIAYRKWTLAHGPRTYLTYLITHPAYLIDSLWRTPNPKESVGDGQYSMLDLFGVPYRGYDFTNVLYPDWLRGFMLAPFGRILSLLCIAVLSARYVWQTIRRRRASSVEIAALAAVGAIFITYHSDALDTWRHTVPYLIVFYVSVILRFAPICLDFPLARLASTIALPIVTRGMNRTAITKASNSW